MMKYLKITICITAIALLAMLKIGNCQEEASQEICTPPTPKHISEVLDAIRNGLVALDKYMLESEKKLIPLADQQYCLDISPHSRIEDAWYMNVTFLPRKPSAEMWITIKKTGEVEVAEGL